MMKRPTDFINDILRTGDERKRQIIVNQVGRNTLADMVLELASILDDQDRAFELTETEREVIPNYRSGDSEKVKEHIQKLEDEIKHLQSGIEALRQIAPERPNNMSIPPGVMNEDVFIINIADEYGGFTSLPADQHCWVTFSIFIRHGKKWEQTTIVKDKVSRPIYPGDKETLIKEIDHRLMPVLHRSPTIDDIPDWQRLEMIPKEELVKAMMELSIARYISAVHHEYQQSLSDAFDLYIKSYVANSYDITEAEARDLFRKIVDVSFENMEKRRNIPKSKSQLPTKLGRPRKRNQESEQIYQRIAELSERVGKAEEDSEQIEQLQRQIEELKQKLTEEERL